MNVPNTRGKLKDAEVQDVHSMKKLIAFFFFSQKMKKRQSILYHNDIILNCSAANERQKVRNEQRYKMCISQRCWQSENPNMSSNELPAQIIHLTLGWCMRQVQGPQLENELYITPNWSPSSETAVHRLDYLGPSLLAHNLLSLWHREAQSRRTWELHL